MRTVLKVYCKHFLFPADSHSVQHENKYRDPKSKHCYGLTEAHESQREVIESNDLV